MSRFRSIAYLLPHLLRSLLTRPSTVRYPLGPLKLPTYFRGRVVIDAERCTGCGLCVQDCPAAALQLIKEDRNTFKLIHYSDRCANCGQCEASCRFGAIRLDNAYVSPTHARSELIEILVDRNQDKE